MNEELERMIENPVKVSGEEARAHLEELPDSGSKAGAACKLSYAYLAGAHKYLAQHDFETRLNMIDGAGRSNELNGLFVRKSALEAPSQSLVDSMKCLSSALVYAALSEGYNEEEAFDDVWDHSEGMRNNLDYNLAQFEADESCQSREIVVDFVNLVSTYARILTVRGLDLGYNKG